MDIDLRIILLAINHSLPWFSVIVIVLMGDITLVEADWRSCVARTLIYIPLNVVGYILYDIQGNDNGVYGFEIWGKEFWKTILIWLGLLITFCLLYKP